MNAAELKAQWTGWNFDEMRFEIEAPEMRAFAEACGERLPRFVDPDHPDFQATPSYTARFHGRRALPNDFPMEITRSFDGGKAVEARRPIRPGDTLIARSQIHDIYEKTGRSGGMLFVVHRMEFTNQHDEVVSIVDWKLIQKQATV